MLHDIMTFFYVWHLKTSLIFHSKWAFVFVVIVAAWDDNETDDDDAVVDEQTSQ